MAESIFEGPVVSAGALLNGAVSPTDGPEISYQGSMFPDPRFSPMNKDGLAPGRVKGFPIAPAVVLVDAIPSATATTNIINGVVPSTTAGIAIALVTAQAGTAAGVTVFAPGVPIIPTGTTAIATVSAIDFGFATGTTVTNVTTVTVNNNALFQLGQWIVIPGVGSSGATNVPLFTQVQSLSTNTTVITVLPAPQTAGSNLPIGQANLYNQFTPPATQFGPAATVPNATEPYRLAGFGLAFDPAQGVARSLAVAAASIGSGTTRLVVSGYDIYGQAMTELFVCDGTTVQVGKKAFKYISGVVTNGAAATTVTPAAINIGVSDVFGINLRADKVEYVSTSLGGTSSINALGFVAALSTTSHSTSADVRGTMNASTAIASTNGARRLVIIGTQPLSNMLNATPNATAALFGVPQA